MRSKGHRYNNEPFGVDRITFLLPFDMSAGGR